MVISRTAFQRGTQTTGVATNKVLNLKKNPIQDHFTMQISTCFDAKELRQSLIVLGFVMFLTTYKHCFHEVLQILF